MATKKVTITLDEALLVGIQALVAAGRARNVSSCVQHAVKLALSDAAGWGAMLQLALQRTGGLLTAKERTSADAVLNKGRHPSPRRGKTA